jgi:hypothetical protein
VNTTDPAVGADGRLNRTGARKLDTKIRAAADRITRDFAALLTLLDEGYRGEIDAALGASNWSAYVTDAAQITLSDDWSTRKEFRRVRAQLRRR